MDSLDLHYRKGTKQNFFFFFWKPKQQSVLSEHIWNPAHVGEMARGETTDSVRLISSFQKHIVSSETCFRQTPQVSHYTANYLNHGLKKLKISYPRSFFATRCVKKAYTPQMTIALNFCCHLKIKQKTLPLLKIKNEQASKQKQQQNRKQEMFESRCLC